MTIARRATPRPPLIGRHRRPAGLHPTADRALPAASIRVADRSAAAVRTAVTDLFNHGNSS